MRKSRTATDSFSANLANLNVNPLADYMLLTNRKLPEIPDQYLSSGEAFIFKIKPRRSPYGQWYRQMV